MLIRFPRISQCMFFCLFFYLWHRLGGDFAISGVSPAPFLFAELSHSISFAPILLSVSHTSPLLAYLHSREHPRKAEKIENTLEPVDETEAARTFPYFLAPIHGHHSLHSFSLATIPNFCCFYEFSFLRRLDKSVFYSFTRRQQNAN